MGFFRNLFSKKKETDRLKSRKEKEAVKEATRTRQLGEDDKTDPGKNKQEEPKEKRVDAQFDKLVEEYKKQAMGMGYDEEGAKKWAWKKIEKKLEKRRTRMGIPVVCVACRRYGVNAKTGGMVKLLNREGYRHQNCSLKR